MNRIKKHDESMYIYGILLLSTTWEKMNIF